MDEKNETKAVKSYSLDPKVIDWVMVKTLRLRMEEGTRLSESSLVNDILTAAMEKDQAEEQESKKAPRPTDKKSRRAMATAA